MSRRLVASVVVTNPETHQDQMFLMGTPEGDVDDWARELIDNPDVWEDDAEVAQVGAGPSQFGGRFASEFEAQPASAEADEAPAKPRRGAKTE